MNACDIIANYLEKSGGEGSRGGHVIGHTKRGNKPIYSKGGEHHNKLASAGSFRATPEDIKAAADSFPGWTATDHAQARDALRRTGDALERQAESAAFSTGGQLTPRYHQHMSESGATSAAASGHAEIAKYKQANKKVGKSMGDLTSPHNEDIMQACDIIADYLAKAGKTGEGSRGGKILAHTKSGKPIYAHKQSHDPAYAHFGAQDHKDAADAHDAEMKRHDDIASNIITHNDDAKRSEKASAKHEDIGAYHKFKANEMKNEERANSKKSMAGIIDLHKGDWSASDILGAYVSDLNKSGGEGSRGGRIIGHTASGPVYAHQKASSAHYSKFRAKDHGKAGEAHSVEAHRYRGLALNSKGEDAHHWTDMQAHHEKKADDHFKKEHSLSKSDGDGDCGLSKGGGEGSRGGKILKHTSSGKPVYAANKQVYGGMGTMGAHGQMQHVMKQYPEYSAQDHADAAEAHKNAAEKIDQKPVTDASFGKFARHVDAFKGHHAAARTMSNGAQPTPKVSKSRDTYDLAKSDSDGDCGLSKGGGEGSRGGKIIGHTRSGKPVYSDHKATNRAYRGFTAADHGDAADLHMHERQKNHGSVPGSSNEKWWAHNTGFTTHAIAAARKDRANKSSESGNLTKSDGDGDHGHEFADANNQDPDRVLVRQVGDVNQSALNDAIAASWPGTPYLAHSAENFCNMANSYTQGE